ncbi:45193_t:CDS:1, partial [Gigaspora margarita]
MDSYDSVSDLQSGSSSKHVRIESVDESVDVLDSIDSDNLYSSATNISNNINNNIVEESAKKKLCKGLVRDKKGKNIDCSLRSTLRSYNSADSKK